MSQLKKFTSPNSNSKWFWVILFYFMYDDILRWLQSPFMLFLLVLVAGTFGYLHATNNLHYISNAYNSLVFVWNNIIKDTLKAPIQEEKGDNSDKRKQD